MASLNELWNSALPPRRSFDPALVAGLPPAPRAYLQHAIAPSTPLASAVHLHMHGKIKLKRWYAFSAEQVINWDRGMIWRASVRVCGLPITGGDSFIDSQGTMKWRLLGIVPVVNASGTDITRSAAGRVNIESIWLPSVLCSNQVSWSEPAPGRGHAHFSAHSETADIDYGIDEQGRLKWVSMPRWGNPDGSEFRYYPCGGIVEEEGTFGGYTIPIRMRVGWHFGSPAFASEGEFFHVTIDEAIYR
jgi:hypothetical protein